jgi:large subunit ribosomal protein L22
MEAKAIARSVRQSPRKIRKSLNSVRRLNVEQALNYLHYSKEKAAKSIEVLLKSAVSNLNVKNNNETVNLNDISIKEAYVNGGAVMKRFRAASMGRASRLRKPTSHITVVISIKK